MSVKTLGRHTRTNPVAAYFLALLPASEPLPPHLLEGGTAHEEGQGQRGSEREAGGTGGTGSGGGTGSNISRCGYVFVTLHCPADSHSTDIEMLGNGLHTVGARAVSLSHRVIAVWPASGIVGQRLGQGSALTLWDVPQRARRT